MSFQHLSHAWLLPAVTIACLSACRPTHITSAATAFQPVPPVRGNQYYSRQNAKYLGSDGSGSAGYRLIDCATFSTILQNSNGFIDKQAAREMYDSSLPISIVSISPSTPSGSGEKVKLPILSAWGCGIGRSLQG
jgi:hypothetical protein